MQVGNANYNIRQLLHTILNGMVPDPELEVNLTPLGHLVAWFREDALGSDFELDRRFAMLLETLRDSPVLMGNVKAYLEQLLSETHYRYTFAELGILGNETFGQAIKSRLLQKLLPATVEDKTLRETLGLVFHKSDDHVWLQNIALDRWAEFFTLMNWLDPGLPVWKRIQEDTLTALELLAVRVAALGIDSEVVRCLDNSMRTTTPFVEQHLELRQLTEQAHIHLRDGQPMLGLGSHLDVLLDQCSVQIRKAYAQARVQGISVTLSMQLTRLEQSIARMRLLLMVIGALPCEHRVAATVDLFCTMVREENRKNSIVDLWSGLTDKMALRITEHASKTGEKYATETRAEYLKMAGAAVGAGVVIAFLSLFKAYIGSWHLPPLWEALFFSLNYGMGFVLIHILHFTIATKQPAMTAARIAAAIDAANGRLSSMDRVVELVVQVARTQFIAIWGNVIPAFLTATGVAMLITFLIGEPPVGIEKSEKMLLELNPVLSGAIPHAAIAGVFLFLAGVISGFYDNLSIYHRVPSRLRKVLWLRRTLGVVRLNRFADYLGNNLGALTGNFFFGCMLGSAGFVGLMLGLPIDIRHITFAAANMAYATQAQAFALSMQDIAVACAGVLMIGLTNLAVSFSLAFYTALKARGVRRLEVIKLTGRLGQRFLSRPRDFFIPPRAPDDAIGEVDGKP